MTASTAQPSARPTRVIPRPGTSPISTPAPAPAAPAPPPPALPVSNKGRRQGWTVDDYRAALIKHRGMTALAAAELGVTVVAVRMMYRAHPELKELCDDAREHHIDTAESMLRAAVARGEAWAICFTLKTIGHSRGYIERHEWKSENETKLTKETITTVRTEQLLDTAKLLAGKSFSRLAAGAEDAN